MHRQALSSHGVAATGITKARAATGIKDLSIGKCMGEA
jgi:hypothetical protein